MKRKNECFARIHTFIFIEINIYIIFLFNIILYLILYNVFNKIKYYLFILFFENKLYIKNKLNKKNVKTLYTTLKFLTILIIIHLIYLNLQL